MAATGLITGVFEVTQAGGSLGIIIASSVLSWTGLTLYWVMAIWKDTDI